MINTLDCPNNEKPMIYICNVKRAMRSRADSITSAFVSQTRVKTATVSKYLGDLLVPHDHITKTKYSTKDYR